MPERVDIVVVGAGHAGCEAAAAAARLGRRVVLVTLRLDGVALLSCNPAIGGLGKGHLVRELDALGGLMARVTDSAIIQFRYLNTRRGLAVRSSRAQVDTHRYPAAMAALLRRIPGLTLLEGEVSGLLVGEGRVEGVTLQDGATIPARHVILTTGTFLSAVMHCGDERVAGGRLHDISSDQLSPCLSSMGLRLDRLKTGTTPRVDGRHVDWSRIERQPDLPGGHFSFSPPTAALPRLPCHLTHTTPDVHEVIRDALPRAPLFTGAIQGRGPRYCPSVEDKVVRFPDKEQHLLFLEPEGLDTPRVYVNGLPTSLPRDVQDRMVALVPGLERAPILQHGYAVEYDYADPRDLGHDLQHLHYRGLYLAGQVCGTSGYEEAAAQGFVAGVSAAREEPLLLQRHQAYMGVLVDDLVTRGVGGEPYRMFTSRAEFRLTLREDNADRRLTPMGRDLGLVDDQAWARFCAKMEAVQRAVSMLETTRARIGGRPLPLSELVRRPEVEWEDLARHAPSLEAVPEDVAEQVVTDIKYAGYIERDARRAREAERLQAHPLPPALLDSDLPGLSTEVRQRLREARPPDLAAASRLPGVTPAAIHILTIHLGRLHAEQGAAASAKEPADA